MPGLFRVLRTLHFPFGLFGKTSLFQPSRGKNRERQVLFRQLLLAIFGVAFALLIALPSSVQLETGFLQTPWSWLKNHGATSLPELPGRTTLTLPDLDLRGAGIPFTTDLPLKLGLDIRGGTQVTLEADLSQIPETEQASALQSVQEIVRRRVDLYGVSEPRIRTTTFGGTHQLYVELPGLDQPDAALQLIGQTAKLEFREPTAETATATQSASTYIDSFRNTELSGKQLQRATVSFSPNTGEPVVSLQFNSEGAQLFGTLTEKHLGEPLAIFLDNQPVSFPRVQEAIYGGQAQISGGFTLDAAKTLTAQLNAGALPVPIKVVEQGTIGASLGDSSLRASVVAGSLGLGLVCLFMILLYGWAGTIAVVGLFVYAIFTVALYKLIPVTLTGPGIAGLILSIGMAVDANILTFARIQEELRAGKSWEHAVKRGFGQSWHSIKDANLATLSICAILFNPLNWGWLNSSGPIRGFAVTLALGIGISLLTGVWLSRLLIQLFLKPQRASEGIL